ncbi:MAG: hypothetical protein AB8F34_02775 [Akkermansiaceae bacterium]
MDYKKCSLYAVRSLALALPVIGIMCYDDKILATVELAGPVELYKSHPECMEIVRKALIFALVFAFTPFKRVAGIAVGIVAGALGFYGMDVYTQLAELSEMGLSSKPLQDMVEITSEGQWLIRFTALAVAMHCIDSLIDPSMKLWAYLKNKQKK